MAVATAVVQQPLSGLGLPTLTQRGGYFTPKNAHDVAWSDLMIAVFTPLGGRAMERNFGSAVFTAVFDPIHVAQANLVNRYIRQAAKTWCPHINVLQVQSAPALQGISLGVVFSLVADKVNQNKRTVLIPFSSTIRLLQKVG